MSSSPDTSLFRTQALQANRRRLWGDLLLTQPPGTGILVLLVLSAVVAAGALLWWGQFTRTERVRGYLVPAGGVVSVQTPHAAVVARLLVSEGDTVARGDALVELRDARGISEGGAAGRAALGALDAQLARLGTVRAEEEARFVQEAAELEAALERADARRASVVRQREVAAEERAVARRQLTRLEALGTSGHASAQRIDAVRRDTLALQRQQETLGEAALRLAQQRADLADRLRSLPRRRALRLAELEDRRDTLRRERAETEGRVAFVLRAPMAGRVAALGVVVGETARPGRDLLSLLAPEARMSAVLLVPSRAVGFVQPGQSVRLLYEAFPFTRFGAHSGRIVGVSRSILAPEQLSGPARASEPVYKVRVALEEDAVEAYGRRFPLQAGMALEADVQLERRRLIGWVVEPLLALKGRL